MSITPTIRVVAAVIERDGRYLITQRRSSAVLPLMWEFPGGRVEAGETDSDALRREVLHRLGVEIEPGQLISYVNHRFLKLPTTIGLMLIAMASSLLLVAVGELFPAVEAEARAHLEGVDFNKTLMQGMLGFLLFAAALHVNLADLKKQRAVIGILATGGVALSTVTAKEPTLTVVGCTARSKTTATCPVGLWSVAPSSGQEASTRGRSGSSAATVKVCTSPSAGWPSVVPDRS